MEHFRKLIPRKLVKGYERVDPLAARWKPPRGYFDHGHYRGFIDLMGNDDVI